MLCSCMKTLNHLLLELQLKDPDTLVVSPLRDFAAGILVFSHCSSQRKEVIFDRDVCESRFFVLFLRRPPSRSSESPSPALSSCLCWGGNRFQAFWRRRCATLKTRWPAWLTLSLSITWLSTYIPVFSGMKVGEIVSCCFSVTCFWQWHVTIIITTISSKNTIFKRNIWQMLIFCVLQSSI